MYRLPPWLTQEQLSKSCLGHDGQVEEGEDGAQMNSTTPNIMAIYSALQTPRIGLTPIPSPTPVPAVTAAPTYTSIGVGTNMVSGKFQG